MAEAANWERLARTLGQLGNVVMGLLVLPCSRNSALLGAMGVSWERALRAHTFLGYLFLLTALAHMSSWWLAWPGYGLFPAELLPFPSKYDPDNWAIGLQVSPSVRPSFRPSVRPFSSVRLSVRPPSDYCTRCSFKEREVELMPR
jgi:hypothetical protein